MLVCTRFGLVLAADTEQGELVTQRTTCSSLFFLALEWTSLRLFFHGHLLAHFCCFVLSIYGEEDAALMLKLKVALGLCYNHPMYGPILSDLKTRENSHFPCYAPLEEGFDSTSQFPEHFSIPYSWHPVQFEVWPYRQHLSTDIDRENSQCTFLAFCLRLHSESMLVTYRPCR